VKRGGNFGKSTAGDEGGVVCFKGKRVDMGTASTFRPKGHEMEKKVTEQKKERERRLKKTTPESEKKSFGT